MSTKNLARTVIEGGRRNTSHRRASNGAYRAQVRDYSGQLARGADVEAAVFPTRETVYRSFDDKLSPAQRWLASKVGRSWDKSRSELFARFDIRTTAGRHIVFDHLLGEIAGERHSWRSWYPYLVDRNGVLRRTPEPRPRYGSWRSRAPLPEPREAVEAWLGGRRVLPRGERLYWLEPTEAGFFRQAKALSEADGERWLALPKWFRDGE